MTDAPKDDLKPQVALRRTSRSGWLAAAGVGGLGLLVFAGLSQQRAAHATGPARTAPAAAARLAPAAIPPPADLAKVEAAARGAATPVPAPAPPPAVLAPPAPPPPLMGAPANVALEADRRERLKTPAVIVDLGAAPPAPAEPARSAAAGGGAAPRGSAKLSSDEQFADRVAGAEPERARVTTMRSPAALVPQGAVIPAVLETALNSDLPGFARAVVSRDVRGFDGSQVLIPRGSRLVGQYSSGVSQGQSRAFVIWTRLIRPDGASIQIGSPAADTLGRAGLDGQVDRHFFERFSGSILLSVVNAGVASLIHGPSTQVVIGAGQDAGGLAAALTPPTAIAPTIKVAQGSPIRVFVARDLDFTGAVGLPQ